MSSPEWSNLASSIAAHSTILIFSPRHSDLDAAGSAIGLLNIIKDNFKKDKELYLVGFDIRPRGLEVPQQYLYKDSILINEQDTLGISVDAAALRQLKHTSLIKKCKEFYVIDHHEHNSLKDDIKREIVYINDNTYGSCCGLILAIGQENKWVLSRDVLSLLTRGHLTDTRGLCGVPGVGETSGEFQKLGIDVSYELNELSRWPLYMLQTIFDLIREGEKDKNCFLMTLSPHMIRKYGQVSDSLFTFPLMFLHLHLKVNTIVYFHYLLRQSSKFITHRNIFVCVINDNPELDELLLNNGFQLQRKGYYKLGCIMEFKELYSQNQALFNK